MSNHSTTTSIEKSLIAFREAFSDKPLAVILPIHLKLAGDYATAAALAQVFYWHKIMKRAFYKTDEDWCEELQFTPRQWETVKAKLKKLSFLSITRKGIPAKTFYDIIDTKLAEEITNYTPKKSNKSNKTSFKATKDNSLPTLPETGLPTLPETGLPTLPETGLPTLPETNTETTQLLLIINNIADVDFSVLTEKETPAAKKLLEPHPIAIQIEVMAVLTAMVKAGRVKSTKIGYLRKIVESVNDGSFTPLPAKEKPLTAADRIAKEERTKAESDKRAKAAADRFWADQGLKS